MSAEGLNGPEKTPQEKGDSDDVENWKRGNDEGGGFNSLAAAFQRAGRDSEETGGSSTEGAMTEDYLRDLADAVKSVEEEDSNVDDEGDSKDPRRREGGDKSKSKEKKKKKDKKKAAGSDAGTKKGKEKTPGGGESGEKGEKIHETFERLRKRLEKEGIIEVEVFTYPRMPQEERGKFLYDFVVEAELYFAEQGRIQEEAKDDKEREKSLGELKGVYQRRFKALETLLTEKKGKTEDVIESPGKKMLALLDEGIFDKDVLKASGISVRRNGSVSVRTDEGGWNPISSETLEHFLPAFSEAGNDPDKLKKLGEGMLKWHFDNKLDKATAEEVERVVRAVLRDPGSERENIESLMEEVKKSERITEAEKTEMIGYLEELFTLVDSMWLERQQIRGGSRDPSLPGKIRNATRQYMRRRDDLQKKIKEESKGGEEEEIDSHERLEVDYSDIPRIQELPEDVGQLEQMLGDTEGNLTSLRDRRRLLQQARRQLEREDVKQVDVVDVSGNMVAATRETIEEIDLELQRGIRGSAVLQGRVSVRLDDMRKRETGERDDSEGTPPSGREFVGEPTVIEDPEEMARQVRSESSEEQPPNITFREETDKRIADMFEDPDKYLRGLSDLVGRYEQKEGLDRESRERLINQLRRVQELISSYVAVSEEERESLRPEIERETQVLLELDASLAPEEERSRLWEEEVETDDEGDETHEAESGSGAGAGGFSPDAQSIRNFIVASLVTVGTVIGVTALYKGYKRWRKGRGK